MSLIDLISRYYGQITVIDKNGREIWSKEICNLDFNYRCKDLAEWGTVEICALGTDDDGTHLLRVWIFQTLEEMEKKKEEKKEEQRLKWKRKK